MREYFLLGFLALIVFWQMGVLFIGIIAFMICRLLNISLNPMLMLGIFLALLSWLIIYSHDGMNFIAFMKQGFHINYIFFKLCTKNDLKFALYYLWEYDLAYLTGFPLLFASILQLLQQLTQSTHAMELKRLYRGEFLSQNKANEKRVQRALKRCQPNDQQGIFLGVSTKNYKPIMIPDYYVNQIILVLGTTGSGKTVTLKQFARYAIRKGYPLLLIDGKPTEENVNRLWQEAYDHQRTFQGFNCANFKPYNALWGNSYTELKDKIMTLKDQWESDYYRSVAEDYLQTTLEVLITLNKQVDLKTLSQCLNFDFLAILVREANDPVLAEKIKALQHYEQKSLTGLQAHLNALINSELGGFLQYQEEAFTLNEVIEQKGVAYFALPALKFPSFAKVLGKLIINDIKASIEPLNGSQPIFIIFDEFSVFAGEQVLNLVNMGRGKGVHAIFGTQGLADLKKVDSNFESQLLNCVNTIICHRLNHQESAESITKWIGTEDSFDLTAVVNAAFVQSNMGSLSKNKSFIVHPDDIKQHLQTGEAYLVSKIGKFKIDRLKVKMNL